jgi:predicted transcriptional regulator
MKIESKPGQLVLTAETVEDVVSLHLVKEKLEAIVPLVILETIEMLRKHQPATTRELAEKWPRKVNANALNQRLIKLYKMGIVSRASQAVAEGGKEYVWRLAVHEQRENS